MPVFTTANAADAAAKSHAARKGHGELKQALVLKDLDYKAALAICPTLSPCEKLSRDDAMAMASLFRSWDLLSNRVRILRGKPLPGSRRPAPEPAKKASARTLFKNRPPVTVGAIPGPKGY
jgi:hypothetical protein